VGVRGALRPLGQSLPNFQSISLVRQVRRRVRPRLADLRRHSYAALCVVGAKQCNSRCRLLALTSFTALQKGGRYRINSGQTAPSGLTSSAAFDPTATSVLANGQGQKYADFAPTCWASTRFRDALITDALAPMGRGGWRSGALDDFAAPSVRDMRREEWLVCPAAIWTHCLAVMPVRSTPREI
jgi:hypothetical protein